MVDLPQLLQQRRHPLGAQQLRGVGGNLSRCHNAQVGYFGGKDGLLQQCVIHQNIAQSHICAQGKQTGQLGPAQVTVNQQNLTIRLRKGYGQVHRGNAFPLTHHSGGNLNDLVSLFARQGKNNVAAQRFIGFLGKKVILLRQKMLALLQNREAFCISPLRPLGHMGTAFFLLD